MQLIDDFARLHNFKITSGINQAECADFAGSYIKSSKLKHTIKSMRFDENNCINAEIQNTLCDKVDSWPRQKLAIYFERYGDNVSMDDPASLKEHVQVVSKIRKAEYIKKNKENQEDDE